MTSVAPQTRRTTRPAPLIATHEAWAEPLVRPAMATTLDRHERVGLTNRYIELDGRRVIPVSGELHFSRVPRAEWEERLRLMRAGGVTVVATYVFWNHHEAAPGRVRFDGGLDVGAFVETCARVGLDVVMRIGPWCHGEVRNGGFPDWVQASPVVHRTDDPAYLALVEPWFAALGAQLAPLCGPTSNIIAIQLENELYDQPGHIRTLKALARRHGMTAPIYTATAWGGAELPAGEVLPLFGGYGDGFWVDADHDWDTTFREHFFFSHTWDDPGIGADLRDHPGIGRRGETPRLPSASFPAATCELGGGMATAYHRRPLLSGADVAAVAHNKIGNGSGWQGYYMYAGGTNPRSGAAGVARDRISERPARVRLRLPCPDRRSRQARTEPRGTAAPARVPRRLRRRPRRDALDASRPAARERRRRRHAPLGAAQRRDIRLDLPHLAAAARAPADVPRCPLRGDARRRRDALPRHSRRRARRHRRPLAPQSRGGRRPRRLGDRLTAHRARRRSADARARRRGGHPRRARRARGRDPGG